VRKITYKDSIPELGESLLSNFHQDKLATQISDARERASLKAYKVGHPQGMVDVPGKRGWIYVQRVNPSGNTVLEVFVPTDANGRSRVRFKKGQVIAARWTSDTNPTYLMYDGIPPSTKVTKKDCSEVDPCDSSATGHCDMSETLGSGGNLYGTGSGTVGTFKLVLINQLCPPCDELGCTPCTITACAPQDYECTGGGLGGCAGEIGYASNGEGCGASSNPTNETTPSKPLPNGLTYYDGPAVSNLPPAYPVGTYGEDDEGAMDFASPTAIPKYSPPDQPPVSPITNELWDDGTYVRRFKGKQGYGGGPTGWKIISGPNPGEYQDVRGNALIQYGRVAYKLPGDTDFEVGLGISTDLDVYGKVLGVVVETIRADGKLGVVQSSGIAYLTHTFDAGTRLYMGSDGKLTDTPPGPGTGRIMQQIATVINDREIMINLGQPVIRSS
jgi:hypothetical protein